MSLIATLDDLVALQRKDAEKIAAALKNFKKEPRTRKTLVRLEKLGTDLDKVWGDVVRRDDEIKELDEKGTSQYVIEKEMAKIMEYYLEFKSRLDVDINQAGTDMKSSTITSADAEIWKSTLPQVRSLLKAYMKKYSCIDDQTIDAKTADKYIANLEQKYESYIEVVDVLVSESTHDQKLALESERDEIIDEYQRVIVELDLIRSGFKESELNNSHNNQYNGQMEMLKQLLLLQQNSQQQMEVRLPRMEIPKFSGNAKEWMEFHDIFETLIHNKTNLPPIQKMHYLKSSLTGDASNVIKHLSVSNENYEAAWMAINKRYNNKPDIIDSAWQQLLEQKGVGYENSNLLKTLLDCANEATHILRSNNILVDDSLLIYVISRRLPTETRSLWEYHRHCQPGADRFGCLERFLECRFRTLDAIGDRYNGNENRSHVTSPTSAEKPESVKDSDRAKQSCMLCSGGHKIFSCHKFKNWSSYDKLIWIRKIKLCIICLKQHGGEKCRSTWECFLCKGKHNTVLHEALNRELEQPNARTNEPLLNIVNNTSGSQNVILATAVVKVIGKDGEIIKLRALVDQGSMSSFISEKAVNLLKLKRERDTSVIAGIGGVAKTVNGKTTVSFKSIFKSNKQFTATTLILPKLTGHLPTVNTKKIDQYDKLKLADKNYNVSGNVDLLLGADVYKDILMMGMIKGPLLAQKTHLGWILSGAILNAGSPSLSQTLLCSNEDLDNNLQKFWEIEEKIVPMTDLSSDQQDSEKIYETTTTRSECGQYICRLPFKNDVSLGRSRHIAIANLLQLEKRFIKHPSLRDKYSECMNEYFGLGHAVPAVLSENHFKVDGDTYNCYYIPHLAVFKEESQTTKTRIVFNASSKTSNGRSLNDNLLVGPTIQPDIVDKINRFRQNKWVIVSDVTKMYRQIGIHQDDWNYQRFVWRDNDSDPIRDYCLTTVTFGEASAPFTAIRTLKQIAIDNKHNYPLASDILNRECYVVDIHFGHDDLRVVAEGRDQLRLCLKTAGMELRKWSSNNDDLLQTIPDGDRNMSEFQKFMGLKWNRVKDEIQYCEFNLDMSETTTKRMLLTQIAKIYDPMGWIQPLIVPAKILMQLTWKLNIGWDDVLPEQLLSKWRIIQDNLTEVRNIRVPRWMAMVKNCSIELHGFADASKHAYGAIIYGKFTRSDGQINISVILAKSRVCPVKEITIPRLELKGAVLLAEMMEKVINTFDDPKSIKTFGWLDARVVLCWIKTKNSAKWAPYIRNRVLAILHRIPAERWNYVKTTENPADLISRGCKSMTEFLRSKVWFHGPPWLHNVEGNVSEDEPSLSENDNKLIHTEIIELNCCTAMEDNDFLTQFMEKYSNYGFLCSVLAWILRLSKRKTSEQRTNKSYVTVEERRNAEKYLVRHIQQRCFQRDIEDLKSRQTLNNASSLKPLTPFLCEDGFLRVGGRLRHSKLPYEKIHPIILPSYGPMIILLIEQAHIVMAHGGVQITLNHLRQRFWIVKGVQAVKSVLRKCVTCARHRPNLRRQLMGELPAPRTQFTKAFLHTGLDFAGPFNVKSKSGRGIRSFKAYVAVFVCLSVKALHFELVGSLSSEDLISGIKRFVSRRGTVEHFYSDNGTNNVGAARKIVRLQEMLHRENMTWHFIPPSAPHFGGLWEAGVKSLKTHLQKVIGESLYTYEEFYTVLTQIESVLNSRPLCPLTDDVDDLDALTPQHFLTGYQFIPVSEEDWQDVAAKRLNRWQLCMQQYQEVCRRYKNEYVHRLQQRPKWMSTLDNVKVGQLVLVKEENVPVSRWPLGRIVDIHPGSDGLVRVATIKTKSGTRKRPVTKLSPLPVDVIPDEFNSHRIKD